MRLAQLALLAWLLGALGAWAQEGEDALQVPRSQVLTIDSSRLYPGTILGQSYIAAINDQRRAFAAENQVIAAELRDEELALTEQRAELPRAEFARLAAEFDSRVEAAREERAAQEAELDARAEAQERSFLQQVQPILGQIMVEAGAVALIEASTVFLRNEAIDITEIAIARIDEATQPVTPGENGAQSPAEPAPEEAPAQD